MPSFLSRLFGHFNATHDALPDSSSAELEARVDAEMAEIVIVEHQGHEIDTLCRRFGRNGIGERSGNGDD